MCVTHTHTRTKHRSSNTRDAGEGRVCVDAHSGVIRFLNKMAFLKNEGQFLSTNYETNMIVMRDLNRQFCAQ